MQNLERNVAVIILAAGLGTRMKSGKAKVLHKILGKPMVIYVVETAKRVAGNNVILVVGNQADKMREIVSENNELIYAIQKDQLGTGHAVLCALPYIPEHIEEVVILCGDVPLLSSDTIVRLIDDHIKAKRDISLLAVEIDNPTGYGRVILDEDLHVSKIVEEADATDEQKKIKTINTGIYCVKKKFLLNSLVKIKSDNAQAELYFTDIVEIGYREKKVVGALASRDYEEIIGVNTCQDLITVETVMHKRLGKIS
ncbi:MAG: NTP transferase domain-containing protein [Spirochaetales bacterium]|jgi:UDP-N-acetylglucosamine diphosphorylase/glucosamine-1-phosphate N-acetyltransferase|nr:NTP transferase domain-containing protein [Spirochaetales bacterium]